MTIERAPAGEPVPLALKGFEIEGCRAAYLEGGRPGGVPLLLMHGVGPGAAVSGAFAPIFPFLLERFHIFAMDLIGFGNSGRKPAPPYFDFALWQRQAEALAALMPARPMAVFGHSLSGAVALGLAARLPRVAGVITTGTIGTRYALTADLARLWTFPTSRDALRQSLKSLLFDADRVPEAELDRRWSILQAPGYGAYFSAMFAGDKQALMDSWVIPEAELAAIRAPVTLVHGRDDRACPPDLTSAVLAERIPHADLVLLARCAHAPAMEQPAKVMASVRIAFSHLID